MTHILSKKEMTEEDIKLRFITPAITEKWSKDKILMEAKITDGRIDIRGNCAVRKRAKYADYLLCLAANHPIAVVEAKDNSRDVSHGLQQAMEYAQMLDLPFAYSSNGDSFAEHDFLTGEERIFDLGDFPSESELIERFKRESNGGKGLTRAQLAIIEQPYCSSAEKTPRYYQRIAVNRTVDAIARGQRRLLLVMATGTGKTLTAFQIVYRLLKARMVQKVLYLADRNILVDQTIAQDFKPLEKVIHKISAAREKKDTVTSYEVYFALYQQLVGDDDREHYSELFAPDFFDLIIVDECHRGSAKEESRWRRILEYFSSAAQIGMTATPKETKYVSNLNYFGDPVYTYSLRNGIDDGFLAPFRVIQITMDVDSGWRPSKNLRDTDGNAVEDRIYNVSDYDRNIIIEDRTWRVASEITRYLKRTDRMARTIVFCENEDAADRMRMALARLNAGMMKKYPDYVVRITGSDEYGKKKLDYFISAGERLPVIATTSKLLSTGVDCKMVKLIAIDETISSMTEFKQIIGRGTRLREKEGKMQFAVMDFRGVSRLFADPDWDGEPVIDDGFGTEGAPRPQREKKDGGEDENDPNDRRTISTVSREGCPVSILRETVSVYDADGKLLRQESLTDYVRQNILGQYASLGGFIHSWSNELKKEAIRDELLRYGIDLEQMKAAQNMTDVDDYDFICHVAFDQKPLTRRERAQNVRKRDFLSRYSGVAREVLDALLKKYADEGVYEIENINVLRLDPFCRYGKPAKIARAFGGRDNFLTAVAELENAIYEQSTVKS